MPQYEQRIVKDLKAKGLSNVEIADVLAGTSKHGRQRTHGKPKRVRKAKPQSKHKKKGKKPVRKKPVKANPKPRYRRTRV